MGLTVNRTALSMAAVLLFGCGALSQPTGGNYSNNSGSFNNNTCTAFGDGNTIICNPARVGFSDELGDQIIRNMPDKRKSVDLRTIGGNIDQAIGGQVQSYLIKHGYKVERTAIGIMSPPADYPYTIQINGDQYQLTVAPSAH